MIKFVITISILCLTFISYGQNHIGLNIGFGGIKLFDNVSDVPDYFASYPLSMGLSINSFYMFGENSKMSTKVDFGYKHEQNSITVYGGKGLQAFSMNNTYASHLLAGGFSFMPCLMDKNMMKINIFFGPTVSYSLSSIVTSGNGWSYDPIYFVDTNGMEQQGFVKMDYAEKRTKTEDIQKFNLGLNFGLDFFVSLNDKFDLLIENRYDLYLLNFFAVSNLRYTFRLSGYLSIGLRYQLAYGND